MKCCDKCWEASDCPYCGMDPEERPGQHLVSPFKVIYEAIKKEAGLSDFDSEGIESEVWAILKALKNNGYVIKLA